ncbi:uncharacterized protein LOC141588516 [Silene latifolia]|uniref:uncharacterized protein LOC141588516 n=1 Tax=Silene latifolia TaxID=37657 RepID=UPI003D776CDC
MATTTASSVYKDPLHLTAGDQSLLQLLPQVFSGTSFLHWSRNLRIALISKNKLGFINGTCPKPPETDARYQDWIRTDYTVMRWIQFSLAEDISKSFSYVTSSKQLWEELNERFNQSNALFLYQLRQDVSQIKQGDLTVAEYYAQLRSGWEDIRSLDPLSECDCGAFAACTCNLLKKIVARDIIFLTSSCFEVQLSITSAADPVVNTDSIALTANAGPKNVWRRDNKKVKYEKFPDQTEKHEKHAYFYTRCEKAGHTLEYCWVHKREQAKKNASSQKVLPPANAPSGNGKRFAANVEKEKGFEADTPLDNAQGALLDASFVQAVAQELFKLQSQHTADTVGSSSFTGTTLAASAHVSHTSAYDVNWIIDSGASDHMTYNLATLSDVRQLVRPLTVTLLDGHVKKVTCVGNVKISAKLVLHNVLYLPDFKHNLLSLGKLMHNTSLCANFHPTGCFIQDNITKEILCSGLKFASIYHLTSLTTYDKNKCSPIANSNTLVSAHVTSSNTYLLDARLGHSALSTMKHVKPQHHKIPFPVSSSVTIAPFELIHVDLWGDDYSRTTWTMLLKHKNLVCETIGHFLAYVKTQFNTTVKKVRFDNGTEILQKDCAKLFADNGIVHQTSIPGNPQQNGRVERKHQHLLEVARALRLQAGLPKKFWGDMILAATHIINLLPTSLHDGDKFEDRAIRCIFLGYPMGKKGYRLYTLDIHKVIYSRDVIFREDMFPFVKQDTTIYSSHFIPDSQTSHTTSIPNPSFFPEENVNDSVLVSTIPNPHTTIPNIPTNPDPNSQI